MESLTLEIIKILGPAIWIALALFVYLTYQGRRDREKLKLEYRLLEQQDRYGHLSSRELERDERLSPRYFEEMIHRLHSLESKIDSRSTSLIGNELSTRIDDLLHVVNQSQKVTVDDSDTSAQIVRELSHALNTPLSQIEIASSIGISTSGNVEDLRKSLQSISHSVQICKAFLGAYREIIISGATNVWNPKSIPKALESASQVY